MAGGQVSTRGGEDEAEEGGEKEEIVMEVRETRHSLTTGQ